MLTRRPARPAAHPPAAGSPGGLLGLRAGSPGGLLGLRACSACGWTGLAWG